MVIYDSMTPDGCCSLRHDNPDGTYTRLGVVPGDFDQVKAFAPELLPEFESIWTDEVIQAYKDSLPPPEEPGPAAPPQVSAQDILNLFAGGLS